MQQQSFHRSIERGETRQKQFPKHKLCYFLLLSIFIRFNTITSVQLERANHK